MDLKNKACLITGGTKGIGAATAIAFAERGANIAIVAREIDDEAKQTARSVEALGVKCLMFSADVAKPDQATGCVERTARELGSVDVLVHSAGGPVPGSILEITPEKWFAAFDVHIHAIYFLCRAALPMMQKKKEGAIILVSSSAGKRGIVGNTCYQTVKGTLPQMARALARDFANDNIRINVVAPGVIRTRFHDSMTEQTRRNNLDNRIPLHREGNCEQVATVIRELATNDYITGETVSVDGGLTMRIA